MYSEIFFCENNVSKGLSGVIDRIGKEYPNVTVHVEDCLGHCSYCAAGLIAVIDAEMITGDTPDELYGKIVSRLEKI